MTQKIYICNLHLKNLSCSHRIIANHINDEIIYTCGLIFEKLHTMEPCSYREEKYLSLVDHENRSKFDIPDGSVNLLQAEKCYYHDGRLGNDGCLNNEVGCNVCIYTEDKQKECKYYKSTI